jgi:rsbT co-antagonist protein RsbR
MMTNNAETVDTLRAENAALRRRIAELEQQCAAQEAQLQRFDSELEQRVTERTAELTADRQLLQSVIDNYPAIVYAKDRADRYILVNQHAAAFAGHTPDDILGKSSDELFPPDLAARFRKPDMQVLETGVVTTLENIVSQPDGTRTYLLTIFPLCNPDGEIYGVCGISIDISKRKQMEQELQRQQILLNTVIDNLPGMIYVTSVEGRVLLANQHMATLLDRSREALVGQTEAAMFPAERLERWQAQQREMLSTGKPIQTEEEMQLSDGLHTFLVTRFPLFDDQNNIFALGVISSDITEIRQTEQLRANLQQQVIDAQQEALRELSTPLIPLSDRVVIMPLIGSVDSMRTHLIMETLLAGVAARHAALVILDITGVVVVDTQVARVLVDAAQAVRLLGARVILTGIGPSIAETLVHLGVDLSGIMTWSDLQSAIAWAFRHQYLHIV